VTIAGVLSQQGITLGNAGTGTIVALIGSLATALLGLLAKDPSSDSASQNVKKLPVILLVIGLMGLCSLAQAQMTAAATASAINYQKAWTVGTEQTQSFPLFYAGAQKNNIFSLGAREIIDPGQFQVYGALGNYQPDISALIRKTTFSPDQFALSFDVMGGIATLAAGGTKPAVEGRVNVSYALTPNTALTGAYAGGGLVGQDPFYTVSAGFAYLFGAPTSTKSAARLNFIKRYTLKKARQ
jgi:hypothetical protein